MTFAKDLKRSRPFVAAVLSYIGGTDLQDSPDFFYKGDILLDDGRLLEVKAEVGYKSTDTNNMAVERYSPSGKDGGVWGTEADLYGHVYRDGLFCYIETSVLQSALDDGIIPYRQFRMANKTELWLVNREELKRLESYKEIVIPMPVTELNEYQQNCLLTLRPECDNLQYAVLEIAGEAGEVADKYKKFIRGDSALDKEAMALELGDVLYAVANAAHQLGYTLSEVAQMNHNKLADRYMRNVITGDGDNR